jgi:calpain-7
MGQHNLPLFSTSTNRTELWVSLLEKAYFKVKGGYNHGSLAVDDMQILFGWIPEIIEMETSNFEPTITWLRLFKSFHEGECMLVMCTGHFFDTEELKHNDQSVSINRISKETGLLDLHAYACLDLQHIPERNLFLVKLRNPWGNYRWKGRFSEFDIESWTPELQERLNYDLASRHLYDDGVFWIDWESLCTYAAHCLFVP